MNSFDSGVALFFNHLVRKSWLFDHAVALLANNDLFKGAVFMALVWWAWFSKGPAHPGNRYRIVTTMFSTAVAMALVRILVLTSPFRSRPLHDDRLGLVFAYGVDAKDLDRLSSFPSDHAGLFFALATGLCFISKRLGLFAFAYAALLIALPRMYLGFHFPTDILSGALVGITVVYFGNIYLAQSKGVRAVVDFSESAPQYFYPMFFLLTYQMAELFQSTRYLLGALFHIVKGVAA